MEELLSNTKLLMEFMKKIYTEEILMFDEEGDEWTEEYEEFDALESYISEHPEVFDINDISQLILMFDDKCFSEHLMDSLADIVSKIAIDYGISGIHKYFININSIPEKGAYYGKYMVIRNLMFFDFLLFQNALLKEDTKIKLVVKSIVESITVPVLIEKRNLLLEKLK